mgnify:CR=1 FL=1
MKTRCCCYGCTKRTSTCHSTCQDYKDFQRENDARNQLIRQAKDKESISISVVVRAAEKARKKRERKERH